MLPALAENYVVVTTTFIGNWFEWTGSQSTKVRYYYAAGQRFAMRIGNGTALSTLTYLFGDHLNSTSLTYKADTGVTTTQLYKPWGEVRYSSGTLPTKYTYTGQYSESYSNLLFYGSRHYDPALGRFIQPDSIIPGQDNPMAWDRYAYVMNAPTRYTDPSGHWYYDPGCDCLVATDDNSKNEHPENLDYERDYNEAEGNPLDKILEKEEWANNIGAFATTLDTIALVANGGYALVGNLVAIACPVCEGGVLLVYRYYSLIPNSISTVSMFLWIGKDIIAGENSLSPFSISDDTIFAITTNAIGWLIPEPNIATGLDAIVVSYDLGVPQSIYQKIVDIFNDQ